MLVDSHWTSMDMRWVSDRFSTRFAIIRCPIDVGGFPHECSWIVCRYSWILGGCTLSSPVEQQIRGNATTKTNAETNPDHGQQQKQRERSAGPRAAQARAALLLRCPCAAHALPRRGWAAQGQRTEALPLRCPFFAAVLLLCRSCFAGALHMPGPGLTPAK